MPANTSVWIFQQLGGEGKILKLEDHAAPHGRARKKAVVEAEIEVRTARTYYSGSDVPTRHVFGVKEGDQVIEGRMTDSYGGKDFARAKKREIEAFVRDAQLCTVKWDDLVSVIGFIHKAKLGIESGASVTYRLEIEVDSDDSNLSKLRSTVIEPRGPQDISKQIQAALADMHKLREVPGMKGSFFDSVGSLISSVASVTSAMNSIAGQIDSFVNAPFQLANQLRSALDQFRTAVTALRNTYDNAQVNFALENQNANNQQQFWSVQSAWAASSLDAIRLGLEMERSLAVAQQGNILAIYTAKNGDTWEQISRVAYKGSADRASDIREANGVASGSDPVPGTEYMVPV